MRCRDRSFPFSFGSDHPSCISRDINSLCSWHFPSLYGRQPSHPTLQIDPKLEPFRALRNLISRHPSFLLIFKPKRIRDRGDGRRRPENSDRVMLLKRRGWRRRGSGLALLSEEGRVGWSRRVVLARKGWRRGRHELRSGKG
jgi:hypothetical protein